MLYLYAAGAIEPLADELARVLRQPLADPMQAELVATPAQGLAQWLGLRLATSLGTSPQADGTAGGDGVAANIDFAFPGTLRTRVLAAADGLDADPWAIDRLVWAVLEVLDQHHDDPELAAITALPDGGTRYGRARRVADLFDRYTVHRPAMIRAWARGHDLDGAGQRLSEHDRWQPRLWRLVRERLDQPAPAERLPDLLERVRSGDLALDLPERVSLFGLTTLPGGAPFLDIARAVAARHDVHVFFVHPSPGLARAVARASGRDPVGAEPLRSDDPSAAAGAHPLLRSWARPSRDAVVLLASSQTRGLPAVRSLDPDPEAEPESGPEADAPSGSTSATGGVLTPGAVPLLHVLQAGLRDDRPPAGTAEPDPLDRSIEIHSCHGPTRQVEVLRDALLHALAEDPSLREDQIVVLCPAIEVYAPIIETVFGPSARLAAAAPVEGAERPAAAGVPRLAYRITDRSLRDTYALLGALAALVDLLAGRFAASAVLDFLALPPVRDRAGLAEDELGTIATWVDSTAVAWGLDGDQRAEWGVPPNYRPGTWRFALDRLLLGVAVSGDDTALAPDEILPLGVEGSDVGVLGRFADVLARLADLDERSRAPRPLAQWCELLAEATDTFFAPATDATWQRARVHELLQDLLDHSTIHDAACPVLLDLADVRRVLAERLDSSARRPDFFRGGITVSSLTPLRDIPFRVVALLGMDDGAFGTANADGDDLIVATPHIADRDPRADIRQALLEAVMAASDRLILTRTGHSVVTNLEVPPAVPVAELRETVLATVAPAHRDRVRAQLDIVHPRQAFDPVNFEPGAIRGIALPTTAWSFDPVACQGASARAAGHTGHDEFLTASLPSGPDSVVDLDDLRTVLQRPVREFLAQRLQLRLPRESGVGTDELPTNLDGLETWKLADRLLAARLDGFDTAGWERDERARGSFPAGVLGDKLRTEIIGIVEVLLAPARALGLAPGRARLVPVDITLADGTRIVGTVRDDQATRPGPVRVGYSLFAPKRLVEPWIDLLALNAHDPDQPWQSVLIAKHKAKPPTPHVEVRVLAGPPAERRATAERGLTAAVDLYRRALTEPIPLFPTLSPLLAADTVKGSAWTSDRQQGPGGDRNDAWINVVYGDLELDALLALPARPDDPPGDAPGRARRFADRLWATMHDTWVLLDDDADDADATVATDMADAPDAGAAAGDRGPR